jgi:UPF0755 protein
VTETQPPIFGRAAADHAAQPQPVPEPASVPASPVLLRRSRHARNRFVVFGHFVLSLAVLGAVAAGGAAYYGKTVFDAAGPLTQPSIFVVERNSGLRDISVRLFTEGVVSDERIFQLGVRASGKADELKAGEYEVPAGASMRDVMDIIVSGRSVQYAVTIPEGLTVQQAWSRIADNTALTGDMPATLPAEGTLLADTYSFPRGTARADVVARLTELQTKLVNDIWATRAPDLPISTIEEFVTLASIVEKETALAEERPRVAAVFVNRLRQGMRLQSDPTIIYGIFGGAGKPADRPIYKSDIETPTTYNTYTIDGLPPGPIAIPGRASLEAVARPITTKDLFFVADGTGGHVFAETYEEHNANVKKWRAIEAEREKAAEAAEGQTQQNN